MPIKLPPTLRDVVAPYADRLWFVRARQRQRFDYQSLEFLAKGIVTYAERDFSNAFPRWQDETFVNLSSVNRPIFIFVMVFLHVLIGKPMGPVWWQALPRKVRLGMGLYYMDIVRRHSCVTFKEFSTKIAGNPTALRILAMVDSNFVVTENRLVSVDQYLKGFLSVSEIKKVDRETMCGRHQMVKRSFAKPKVVKPKVVIPMRKRQNTSVDIDALNLPLTEANLSLTEANLDRILALSNDDFDRFFSGI